MRRVDAAAFLTTAVAVLIVNAIAAVAIGCSCYAVSFAYNRFSRPGLQSRPKPDSHVSYVFVPSVTSVVTPLRAEPSPALCSTVKPTWGEVLEDRECRLYNERQHRS